MGKYRVHYGQNLADVAIQVYGSVEGLLKLAQENGLSITDSIQDGDILSYDESKPLDFSVVKSYQEDDFVVNTGNIINKGDFSQDFNADFNQRK